MSKQLILKFVALLLIIPFVMISPINGDLLFTQAAAPSIKTVDDVKMVVFLNDKIVLPQKATAVYSNGKVAAVAVNWGKNNVKSDKAGDFSFYGTVKNYSKKVKLIVTVCAPILSVEDVKLNVAEGSKIVLPSTVNVNLVDGSMKKLCVKWNNPTNTNKVGVQTIQGIIPGTTYKVKLVLAVSAGIKSIDDLVVNLPAGSDYKLPTVVEALLNNNTTKEVGVVWENKAINTNTVGTTIVKGTVAGYAKPVQIVITVSKKTVEDIAKESNKLVLLTVYEKNGYKLGSGSGFIVSEDGKVLTNFHVIDGASIIKATLSTGEVINIKGVYAYDKEGDYALLQLDSTKKFSYAILGDSDKLKVGEDVVAIGSPLGLQNTVSAGIISSYRSISGTSRHEIQTTASFTYGSSGGALFNLKGEVIGITTAIIEGGANLNFAVPINEAKTLMLGNPQLTAIADTKYPKDELNYDILAYNLGEKYNYFTLGSTKINLYGCEIYEYQNNGYKELDVSVIITDEYGDYTNFAKIMANANDQDKAVLKANVEQWLYMSIKDVQDVYPDEQVVGGLYLMTTMDSQPAGNEWSYIKKDEKTGKYVCGKWAVYGYIEKGKYTCNWY